MYSNQTKWFLFNNFIHIIIQYFITELIASHIAKNIYNYIEKNIPQSNYLPMPILINNI